MKKIFNLLLIIALAMSFAACGDDDPKEEEEENPDKYEWTGDWNDPEDPAYQAKHNGEYNPIKGLWEYMGGTRVRYKYTDDFNEIIYTWNNKNDQYEQAIIKPYIINDKAFKTDYTSFASQRIYLYKLDGEFLYVYQKGTKWYKHKRIQE